MLLHTFMDILPPFRMCHCMAHVPLRAAMLVAVPFHANPPPAPS